LLIYFPVCLPFASVVTSERWSKFASSASFSVVSFLGATLRIAFDSFAYRLKKREANNLFVTVSMMVAFSIPLPDMAIRVVFAGLLNMFIYLVNDVFDIQVDLTSPLKNRQMASFLAEHRSAAWTAVAIEGLLMATVAAVHAVRYQSALLPIAFLANVVLIFAYSAYLKRIPFADVLAMALAGATTTMVGIVESALGYRLLGLLAILCAGYQIIQLIRDAPADSESNVKTTAVLIGAARAAWLFRVLVIGAAAYGFFLVGSYLPFALALGVMFPLSVEKAERAWDLARVLFGTVWLALLGQVFLGQLS
jgi:4-hydroxybenzoate polyprenyltransferase